LPLLMALASLSAGVALLIDRASEDELGTGAAVALLGGVALYLVSLVAAAMVTVSEYRRIGASMKLGAAALVLVLLAAQTALPPLAVAGCLVAVLVALIYAERTVIPVAG
jgi:hypothetical protein